MQDEGVISRRDEILHVAEKLFAERGYRETGLNEVAEQLGFHRQAIYHYFKSKDDILLELIGRAGEALDVSADPIFRSDLSPEDKLTELVRNHIRQVLSHAAVCRIQFQELDKIAGPRGDELRKSRAAYVRRFAAVIRDGQAKGVVVDTPNTTLALLIIGMCNWMTEWYGRGTSMRIDELAEHGARLAVHGATTAASASGKAAGQPSAAEMRAQKARGRATPTSAAPGVGARSGSAKTDVVGKKAVKKARSR
jgi:AcrR family transcriptional regulator